MTEIEIRELFGYNVKRLRKSRNISQMQLAENADMAFNFISDIENGKKWVSADTISKLASALEVEPYAFFLPEGFDLSRDRNVTAFANDLQEAYKTIKSRYV